MPRRSQNIRVVLFCLAGALSLTVAGCARNSVHAAAPVAAPPAANAAARPMTTAPDTDAKPPVEAAKPPVIPAPQASSEAALTPGNPPALHKPAAGSSAAEAGSETARPAAPLISPELSPGDEAAYERKTAEDTRVAERNLHEAGGKQWNDTQRDLVEKIRSFLGQSREASRDGDWARAQNLAQKARLLSAELIASF